MDAADRNALVVGASRGLGLGLAQTLAERGWRVTATQRAPSQSLSEQAGLIVETVDIDDDASVAALRTRLEGARYDLIFVVAGIATQARDPVHTVPRAVAAKVYQTNAVSPIRFAEAFADR